jgi:hypothetical protein
MHVESYPTRAEIVALPYCADNFMTSDTSNLEKMWSDIISTNVLGKKTYEKRYANEEVHPNPPKSVPDYHWNWGLF